MSLHTTVIGPEGKPVEIQIRTHQMHRRAGISLSVRTWGCAQPTQRAVVLLAGTGVTAQDWDTVAEDLNQDRVVHAVDLRGHGPSTWPGRYSLDAMAQDIAALLPHLAEALDVIGHSLGGLVACKVASGSSPIRRLVLEDVGVLHPRLPSTPTRPAEELDFDWAVVEQVRPEIDNPDTSWTQVLARITVPTLAISGGPASFVPNEHVRELADSVTNGSWTTVDAGHLIHTARPAEFIRAVRTHLDSPRS